ncbi:S-adenosyl-L-methionine-dependent methyltransferase [Halteromyces radiatus]|uniref:S-adenosyl-L-methionine-dependent methyltransferase n=1 Tax=Halteromyces radiatus TaxID=101107 RepID=UPI0022210A2D|nr:S-adenosyl-L-methionine-dependent methyltransferase [Halteromyces radiatus]KAI8086237.1 S-adenosyl-L-methionine-dependent methyltransferase [Halteromyces radiatus]
MKTDLVFDQTTLQLYSNYVGIQTIKELQSHLQFIQQQLKKIGTSYRCIEHYKFASSRMTQRFFYSMLLKYGQQYDKPFLLDIGCCTGTDLRQLYLDGYPKDYLVGIDTSSHYIDCGYDLFRDRSQCPIIFMIGDIFNDELLNEKQWMVVMAGSVIHLFQDMDQVERFVKRMTQLLQSGGLFVGAHVSMLHTGTVSRQVNGQTKNKFYIGQDDFHVILTRYGFKEIQFETEQRIPEEEEEEEEDTCLLDSIHHLFWLSFSAIYSPLD